MEKEFVPYELALRLKALGFDEPCFATYRKGAIGSQKPFEYDLDYHTKVQMSSNIIPINSEYTEESKWISAPTWQSAFNWFLEKHSLYFRPDYLDELKEYDFQGSIHKLGKYNAIVFIGDHKTHKEAELECLKKLIEIVESKSEEI